MIAAEMSRPPEDARLYDQDERPGVDCWTVRENAVCRVDGVIQWEETDIAAICTTQGDAIWSAFHLAQGWDAKGVALRPVGRGGSWHGSDGETEVRLHVQTEWNED